MTGSDQIRSADLQLRPCLSAGTLAGIRSIKSCWPLPKSSGSEGSNVVVRHGTPDQRVLPFTCEPKSRRTPSNSCHSICTTGRMQPGARCQVPGARAAAAASQSVSHQHCSAQTQPSQAAQVKPSSDALLALGILLSPFRTSHCSSLGAQEQWPQSGPCRLKSLPKMQSQ